MLVKPSLLKGLIVAERREPTVSSGLNAKEDLADRQARSTRQRKVHAPMLKRAVVENKSSSGFIRFTFFITLWALAGTGYAIWQLQLAQQVITNQTTRIVQLEDKFAISDDSASQSLDSVGAKVRELNVKTVKAESEIAKLWATRNVNRAAIGDTNAKLQLLQKSQSKITVSMNKTVNELTPLRALLSSTSQSVAEQDLLLQSVRERILTHSETLKSLSTKVSKSQSAVSKVNSINKRLQNSEEAITSLDAFRRTVNRDLQKLKQAKP
jgi:predicted  nucleic acid-binding Zn-ribbon protein